MTTKNNFKNSLIVAFITVVLVIIAVVAYSHPAWESNDDPTMSMIAHGYGLMKTASPNIIFSNVIWGHLINLTPEINSVLGYDLVYYATLTLSGLAILTSLLFLSDSALLSMAVFVLLIIKPTITPQFTILSGYATLAGFACLMLYARTQLKRALIACSLFFIVGFLIRAELFALVALVSLPLIPWKKIIKPFPLSVAATTGILIIGAAFYNWKAYQGPQWERFNTFQSIRSMYTDFGIGDLASQSAQVLKKYELSTNDVSLITNWFYGDDQIVNPKKLTDMALELRQTIPHSERLTNARIALWYMFYPEISYIIYIAAALLLLSRKDKGLWISWVLCFTLLAAIGWAGRPVVLRLYYPLFALLTFYALTQIKINHQYKLIKVAILVGMTALSGRYLYRFIARPIVQVSDINWDTKIPIVVIGAAIPFEDFYYPFNTNKDLRAVKYFSSSWATFIPGSFSMDSIEKGLNISDYLKQNKDLFIVENSKSLTDLLNAYCQEHIEKPSAFSPAGHMDHTKILKWQCN